MSAPKTQRPQNMGQVFERFAAALKDEQKRGIPRFDAHQVKRIERVVHTLAHPSKDGRSAATPPPSKAEGMRDAQRIQKRTQSPGQHVAQKGAQPSVSNGQLDRRAHAEERRDAAATPPASHVPKNAPTPPTHAAPTPRTSTPSTPASEERLPWMIDESEAPRVERPRAHAPRPTTTATPAPQERAPVASHSAPQDAEQRLASIRETLGDCTRCGLCQTRTHIVFGEGNPNARLFLIGEAPSVKDDASGSAFSDDAGELLNNMLRAMTLDRTDVYTTNILKCHPPNHRAAQREELATCAPFLRQQLEAVQPEVILTLGTQASRLLLGGRFPFAQHRGEWQTWESTLVMPTFHPSYLLQHPRAKASAWKDLQKVMQKLGLS